MRKKINLTFLFFLVSCTIVPKSEPVYLGVLVFDSVVSDLHVVANNDLLVDFQTCRYKWSNDESAFNELRKKFFEVYNEQLVGLSKVKKLQMFIIDSSIFIPDEVCTRIAGQALTTKKIVFEGKEKFLNFEFHKIGHSHRVLW